MRNGPKTHTPDCRYIRLQIPSNASSQRQIYVRSFSQAAHSHAVHYCIIPYPRSDFREKLQVRVVVVVILIVLAVLVVLAVVLVVVLAVVVGVVVVVVVGVVIVAVVDIPLLLLVFSHQVISRTKPRGHKRALGACHMGTKTNTKTQLQPSSQ